MRGDDEVQTVRDVVFAGDDTYLVCDGLCVVDVVDVVVEVSER